MLALCLVLPACRASVDETPSDATRARMLSALPDDALERGVYLFDGDVVEDLSPGSLIAPLIGSLIPESDLVLETGAPPITLLAGLEPGTEAPEDAEEVDGIVIFGSAEERTFVGDALDRDGELDGPLAELAALTAPVGWAGPLPACGPGTTIDTARGALVVALDDRSVEMTILGEVADELGGVIAERLGQEAPQQSPGKPWNSILTSYEVRADGDRVVVEAVPIDLPGGLLRQFLDTRSLSFLRPIDCPEG